LRRSRPQSAERHCWHVEPGTVNERLLSVPSNKANGHFV
jgi:hypothetical protein